MLPRLVTKLLEGHRPDREPSLAWLPVYSPGNRPRVKRLNIPVNDSRTLVVSLRRFSTNSGRRSKTVRQVILRVHFLGFREAAIVTRTVRAHKPIVQPAPEVRPALRTARNLMPLVLVVVGLLGGIYFGMHLEGPPRLYINSGPAPGTHLRTPSQGRVLEGVLTARTKVTVSVKQAGTTFGYNYAPSPAIDPSQKVIVWQPKVMPKSAPVRLIIPKINIDTGVISVGLKANGNIAMPDSFEQVGWYNQGPTPGELGPAIIVGHVDSIHGIAIFWRLRELASGDTFQILRADGTMAVFKVLEVEQFPQNAFPTAGVYGNIKYAGIRLITCGGTFDVETRHYDQNTVIYGALE